MNQWCTVNSFACSVVCNLLVSVPLGLFFLWLGLMLVRESLYKKVQKFLDLGATCQRISDRVTQAYQKVLASQIQSNQLGSAVLTSELLTAQNELFEATRELDKLDGGIRTLEKIGDRVQ